MTFDWSNVLALVAVLISLAAAAFSGWQLLQNRARLRVRATENFIEAEHPEREWLMVDLTNFGAHPTMITQLLLIGWPSLLDFCFRRRSTAKEEHLLFQRSKERPLLLEPGRVQTMTFRVDGDLKKILKGKVRKLAILHSWDVGWKFVSVAKRTAYNP